MPRIRKSLPADRAAYSFGDLLYWHLFIHGTRPSGDPDDAVGREWEPGAFCDLLGNSDRTLRNWIADKHFPDSAALIAQELFGDNPRFAPWRLELAEALRVSRERKLRTSADKEAAAAGGTPEEAETGPDAGDAAASSGGERRPDGISLDAASDDRGSDNSGQRSRSTALVLATRSRGEEASADRRAVVIHPVWTSRPSGHRTRSASRRSASLLVSGLVILAGVYAWTTRPVPEGPVKETPTAKQTPSLPDTSKQGERDTLPPQPAPQIKPPPEARTAELPKPVPPKAEVPPPAADAKQTEAASRAAEEERIERETIAARKAARDAEARAADQAARQRDAEAAKAAKASDDREWNGRQVAGMGYRLMENTSAAGGSSLGQVPVTTVTECALACLRDNCDAFAFPTDLPVGKPRACYRYRKPVTLYAHPSYTAGQRMPDAPAAPQLADAGSPATQAPSRVATAEGASATLAQPDDLTRCANGPVKVTGFRLSCDRILDGGTTLGSAPLRYTVATINDCAAKCRPITRCVGFTFNAAEPEGQRSCVIFGPVPETRSASGWVSGQR